ncbi:tRNA (N6-threonylcarbamoyladenosine(37)-N6)-methyltransferase TrmO [Paracoccus sulfuroxidans]|uniref:tRNA-Thr(GGU) m(6)t(6)A37 methyltransferase TsaA n=1 Tax=Paracoccus sulfuroxidans TaxID=384678 RepID=A0A562P2X7_9RHOB|nr:tRNA (N6-threonylcarbamoyladenosine(37)-N6)-methyltransferase TrmO [Paracoccus sulfuroxidans]TWI38346.1 tRNA-Thr(GGU) m(6)t(6)A37 methyltransferase TsaA [Paracoccus sulfuroxidans]
MEHSAQPAHAAGASAKPGSDLRPHEVTTTLPPEHDAGVWFIGRVHTPWSDRSECPRKGEAADGALCEIRLDPRWQEALAGVAGKAQLQILYWMHLARRDVLRQNPDFGDRSIGTFALRSPLRPNPIASSVVTLERIEGTSLFVRGLDCVDGTPLIDIKPVFCFDEEPKGPSDAHHS